MRPKIPCRAVRQWCPVSGDYGTWGHLDRPDTTRWVAGHCDPVNPCHTELAGRRLLGHSAGDWSSTNSPFSNDAGGCGCLTFDCHLFVSEADAKQTHVVIYRHLSFSPPKIERKSTMPGQRNSTNIAADSYQPFDHLTTVVRPFEAEGSRDIEFQQSTRATSVVHDAV